MAFKLLILQRTIFYAPHVPFRVPFHTGMPRFTHMSKPFVNNLRPSIAGGEGHGMTPMSLSEFHFIGISLTVTLLAMFFLLPLAAG